MGEKVKLFLKVEHQLANVQGIIELDYHYLSSSIAIKIINIYYNSEWKFDEE